MNAFGGTLFHGLNQVNHNTLQTKIIIIFFPLQIADEPRVFSPWPNKRVQYRSIAEEWKHETDCTTVSQGD